MAPKIKNCKACGTEMASNAKACPSCGGRNGMATWVKIVIGVVIAIALIGCGITSCTSIFVSAVDTAIEDTNNGADIIGPDGVTLSGEDAKKATFAIGDQVQIGDLSIAISEPKNKKPGEFDSSKTGNIAIFHVKATNNGDSQAFISSGDFSLYVDGSKASEMYVSGVDFIVDGINSGKTVEGDMAFDVKKGSTFELIYTPNFLTAQEVTFTGSN